MSNIFLDDFTTFAWNNVSSEKYNIYITNNHDLDWISAPEFSNEFISPLGQNTSYYSGISVTHKKKTLNLIGLGLTIEEFRKALVWLDLKEIGVLTFGYDDEYGYQCKIDSISSAKKEYISTEKGEYIYNFSFSVTFVTIGDAYGLGNHIISRVFEYNSGWEAKGDENIVLENTSDTEVFISINNMGNLPTACEISIFFNPNNEESISMLYSPVAVDGPYDTFLSLKRKSQDPNITLTYNTETGLLKTGAGIISYEDFVINSLFTNIITYPGLTLKPGRNYLKLEFEHIPQEIIVSFRKRVPIV